MVIVPYARARLAAALEAVPYASRVRWRAVAVTAALARSAKPPVARSRPRCPDERPARLTLGRHREDAPPRRAPC